MAANDLTVTQRVADYLQNGTAYAGAQATLVGNLITAVSARIYSRTGRRALNQVLTLTDLYNGTGSSRQHVRDYPIQSVTSVSVLGASIPVSPDGYQAGWIFSEDVVIILPGTYVGTTPWATVGKFPRLPKSVQIVYTAGFDATHGWPSGQTGDANFNNAPTDLGEAVTELVALTLRRAGWLDEAEKILLDGKHISFRSWEMPKEVERVIKSYCRMTPIR